MVHIINVSLQLKGFSKIGIIVSKRIRTNKLLNYSDIYKCMPFIITQVYLTSIQIRVLKNFFFQKKTFKGIRELRAISIR